MADNPLKALNSFGQSVWLDDLRRDFVTGGGLAKLILEDGLTGVTSNPAIFAKAIGGGNAMALYEALAIEDVCGAADLLKPVYDASSGRDGYVSMDVSPSLAHDTAATVKEAHRLWHAVARPNLMIRLPATPAGLPAVETLIAEDINVNVTLLFARQAYEQVAERFIAGLERRAAEGGGLEKVSSVASFFVSRIDSAVDPLLPAPLRGKTAIASARLAYASFERIFSGTRWEALVAKGARPQRLLWASTSTRNPAYSDVMYVEELIGSNTVTTLPPATLEAFRDHGRCRASLHEELGASETLSAVAAAGVSLSAVADQLLEEGVKQFAEAFEKLLKAVDAARGAP